MPPMRIRTLGKLAFALTLPFVAGCNTTQTLAALSCAKLISPSLREDTAPAPLPEANTVGEIALFAERQTAAFEVAELKRKGAIEVVDLCQAEQDSLTRRPWWRP